MSLDLTEHERRRCNEQQGDPGGDHEVGDLRHFKLQTWRTSCGQWTSECVPRTAEQHTCLSAQLTTIFGATDGRACSIYSIHIMYTVYTVPCTRGVSDTGSMNEYWQK